jgi:hypothetical protein
MVSKSQLFRNIIIGYILVSILLLLYSYTQVDLNLTLSRVSVWQLIQKSFQYLGFYLRPVSTAIFVIIILILYLIYGIIIKEIHSNGMTSLQLRKIILIISFILFFAYPAFSYDYFNYMFTAKTVIVYHQNPYIVKPLDFSGIEPWTTFMRWTHLTSAYSPVWIISSLPAYIVGLNYFLLTLFTFKILFIGFYLLAIWAIYRSLSIIDKKNAVMGTAIFSLNPLVIIESIVSSHNDIMMVSLAVCAYYIYLKNQKIMAFFILALATAVKTMTVFIIPAIFFKWDRKLILVLMTLAVIFGFIRKELFPWYFLWVMPFLAIALPNFKVFLIYTVVSFGLLMRYAPYIYAGDYSVSVNGWRNFLFFAPVAAIFLFLFMQKIYRKLHSKS